ncbi:MAG: hypothetical protein OXI96_08085 [Acidimicrobiaceae bacterium]|nr:hypothetical protein [Acidimicrobiaceae bacterium]
MTLADLDNSIRSSSAVSEDRIEDSVTLADLDNSVGNGPDVSEDEIAVRYYSDESFLAAIRLRRSGRTVDSL